MIPESSVQVSRDRAGETAAEWWLERDDHGVTARGARGAVARAEVQEQDPGVLLVFWVEERLPAELRTRLTRTAFEHPALRPRRPVSVAFPNRESDVLTEARRHVTGSPHVAGATCLLEGLVR